MSEARAYYNEIDKFCVEWLKNLIAEGLIAPGDVDDRDIRDVLPSELRGYSQCHFFAGIGGWSYALRLAGWEDDRRVWTGSCPCQPFSVAGKQEGKEDLRHLWPSWYRLISECQPAEVFGEQVENAIRHGWLDLVQTDLEREGYAVGKAVLPAACVGSPIQRHRLFFVACANNSKRWPDSAGRNISYGQAAGWKQGDSDTGECGDVSSVARANGRHSSTEGLQRGGEQRQFKEDGSAGELESAESTVFGAGEQERQRSGSTLPPSQFSESTLRTPALDGFWETPDWIFCRDGLWRPVEPGTFPLASGVPTRMGRLRGYGNSIVPQVAAEFIRAYLEVYSLTYSLSDHPPCSPPSDQA